MVIHNQTHSGISANYIIFLKFTIITYGGIIQIEAPRIIPITMT